MGDNLKTKKSSVMFLVLFNSADHDVQVQQLLYISAYATQLDKNGPTTAKRDGHTDRRADNGEGQL